MKNKACISHSGSYEVVKGRSIEEYSTLYETPIDGAVAAGEKPFVNVQVGESFRRSKKDDYDVPIDGVLQTHKESLISPSKQNCYEQLHNGTKKIPTNYESLVPTKHQMHPKRSYFLENDSLKDYSTPGDAFEKKQDKNAMPSCKTNYESPKRKQQKVENDKYYANWYGVEYDELSEFTESNLYVTNESLKDSI